MLIDNVSCNKTIRQGGPVYLRCDSKGCGGSTSRAFVFTTKFINKLVAYNISRDLDIEEDEVLIKKGRSIGINKDYI